MSYNAGDLKWGESILGTPSGEITWNADLATGLVYDSSLYSIDDFEDALQAAFDAWEGVAAVDFTMSAATNVDLDVFTELLSGSTVGLARYTYVESGAIDTITQGSVSFDTEVTWAPFGVGGLDFHAVALHEIGHILGLDHVADTTEIMNDFITTDTLGDGDIAGAQYLYGTGEAAPPPDEEPQPDPGEEPVASGGGGGGAGAIGLLVAIIAALLGLGSGGAAVALAAGRFADDGEDETEDDDGPLLSDLLPVIEPAAPVFAAEEDWIESDQDHEEELFAL